MTVDCCVNSQVSLLHAAPAMLSAPGSGMEDGTCEIEKRVRGIGIHIIMMTLILIIGPTSDVGRRVARRWA